MKRNIFLDCEFNSFRGELLSLALVADTGDYWHGSLSPTDNPDPWVAENVIPVYRTNSFKFTDRMAFNYSMRDFLRKFDYPNICVDWYVDLEYFFLCFNGKDYPDSFAYACTTEIRLIDSLNSKMPHNAYYDALALGEQWNRYGNN